LESTFLITIKELVARLAGDAKVPAKLGHRFTRQPQIAVSHP
jgi:hypothetical protein